MSDMGWRSGQPTVSIEADSDAGRARCGRAADAIGARIVEAAADLLVVDRQGEPLDALEPPIAGSIPLVLIVPLERVDAAYAMLAGEHSLLCEPGDDELVAALSLALAQGQPNIVREASARDQAERFRRLAEDVGRIGRALTRLSLAGAPDEEARMAHALDRLAECAEPSPVDPARVRDVIRLRRLRERFFEPGLFADPAWDIFLDLTAAQLEGEDVPVSSLCAAAAVPPSTALRWIAALTDQGLLVRRADPEDRRRVFIDLAQPVARAMERYFAAIAPAAPPAI